MTSCHSLKHLVSLSSPVVHSSSTSSFLTTTPLSSPPPVSPFSEKLYFLKFSLAKHFVSLGRYSLVTLGTTFAYRPLSSIWGSSLGVDKLQLPFRFDCDASRLICPQDFPFLESMYNVLIINCQFVKSIVSSYNWTTTNLHRTSKKAYISAGVLQMV
ncbi:unnamed protein product [Acanthoscelides obtectus]|uniref:Uncharacterized protein n=1 Tax=Acanthoscelides obtectus TaxID=200917 RepID=A0A9P0MIA6_ACAOB|nr:unnamed protein product [Acanthoscelides obtectus]CAK1665949.1 hypothetical protein AOBTE_LOCUS25067 [Acanthoscelides obtectus]